MNESLKIVRKFMGEEMHLTPGALSFLENQDDFSSAIEDVLANLRGMPDKPPVVTKETVSRILKSWEEDMASEGKSNLSTDFNEPVGIEDSSKPPVESKAQERRASSDDSSGRLELFDVESEDQITVLYDVTGRSTSKGTVEDFIQLFRDRYDKLSKIVQKREGFRDAIPLGNISNFEGRNVEIIGLVVNRRETRKGDAQLVELEDPTGRATVYVKDTKFNESVINNVKLVVTDEVIGARVKVPDSLRNDGRSPLVWGNDIIWPDVPVSSSESEESKGAQIEESTCVALISDLHVGSKMFLSDVFDKFLEWIRGVRGTEEQKRLASQVKYLIVAGDLVDGIGIYPNQQRELFISDVYEQYEAAAELLAQIPENIKIIIAPGNHDAVRPAEPQPALPPAIASPFEGLNIKLVGNPASISICGVDFLIYHGCGFDDLISADPELDREDVVKSMIKVLQKRHLAPIYGSPMGARTPIAPEEKDYMVIEDPPDVLHCGHLHRYGCGRYRGVLMVNSGTFQERTSYMKRMGVVPTPGMVPVMDLQTKNVRTIQFD
ncbi:hypothetical protein AKJ45_01610 [candidate division MSBL1 archaeon SCGC-AAA261F19]|uniref:DNA polymerase II small subunit n=2 Tax=candidate division MSBL1 TaxID=215777 RepID=A0A133VAI2_9EURY|nr:hypothetical protein AKJ43_01160 [candidate division MSBL1 archaeon SCGC-AAA261D19]KXB03434.1 hypothetical protein AKJ45_01610 [candidate division MSBL1 archaeon SCGC-AAA261F19]